MIENRAHNYNSSIDFIDLKNSLNKVTLCWVHLRIVSLWNNCRKKSNTAGFLLLAETFQLNTLQTTVSGSEK